MRAEDFLDSTPTTDSLGSAADFLDAKPANKPGFTSTVKRTAGQMASATGITAEDVFGKNAITQGIRDWGEKTQAENPAGVQSFSDIADKPGLYVKESLGNALPQMAPQAVGGISGRVLGGIAGGAIGSVVPGAGTAVGAGIGQEIGGRIGQALPTFVQEYGGIREEQQQNGVDNKLGAVAAAVPATAIEFALGPQRLLGSLLEGATSDQIKEIAKKPAKEIFKQVGKKTLKGGIGEASEEYPQTILEKWGAEANPFSLDTVNKIVTSSDTHNEALFSAAMALPGGGISSGALYSASVMKARNQPDEQTTTKDKAPPEDKGISGLLPAPVYPGTPGDQIIAADTERQAAIDAADKNAADIYSQRAAYEEAQKALYPFGMPTLTTDPAPLQQRIDEMLNVDHDQLKGVQRTNYEKALESAFNEPVGVSHDKDGREIPLTMGAYLDARIAAADMSRAIGAHVETSKADPDIIEKRADNYAKAGNEAIDNGDKERGQELLDKAWALQSQADSIRAGKSAAPASAPAIPIVGPLSAAANLAVQSGAHAATVSQQQAAIQNSQAEASSTQPGKAETPTTGNREAAPQTGILAGIAAQAPSIAQPAQNTQPQGEGGTPATAQQAGSAAASPAGGEFDVSKRTEQQLTYLALKGKPGWKEAAVAELQKRGVTFDVDQQAKSDTLAPAGEAKSDQAKANSESTVALNDANSANEQQTQQTSDVAPINEGDTKQAPELKSEKPLKSPTEGGLEDSIGWTSMTTVQREGLLHRAGYSTKDMKLNIGGKGLLNRAWENMGKGAREKLISAHHAQFKTADQNRINNQSGDSTEMVDVSKNPEKSNTSPEPVKETEKNERVVSQPKTATSTEQSESSKPFDSDAWDKAREDRIKESKKSGAKHLDSVSPSVEAMRNREIFYVHDTKQRGIIRTVDNRGNVYVYWSDKYSADKEMASEVAEENKLWLKSSRNLPYLRIERNGKTYVFQSTLGSSDLKDYVFADSVSQPKADSAPEAAQDKAPESDADSRFAKNTIFTADKVAAARARLKAKLGTLNSGIDPELLVDGMTIAGGYIESGVRKFSDYAKAMIADLGEGVKPYLLSFYEAARAYPGLNKLGMDSQEEAAKQHQALLTPEVRAAAKDVVGEAPKVEKKKPANLGEAVKLKADWGVEHIDGYTKSKTGANEDTDYGLKGGIKDEFLADAKRYLSAVAKALEAKGYTVKADRKGKPGKAVSVNEAGPAVSGDVYLRMSNGEFDVFAQVGETAVRGMGPEHPQGVSLMVRAGPSSDNFSPNNWMDTSLSAGDLVSWFEKRRQAYEQRGATQPVKEPEANELPDLMTEAGKFTVAKEIADYLIGGDGFKTIIEARKKISSIIGKPIEAATELAKQADEAIETAVVMAGREIVKAGRAQNRSNGVIYDRLVDLYRRQPNLAVRSSTSVRDQAYSTPVPLAYLASELAGITYETSVYEPTAGNGMLLVGASADNVVANELNPKRAAMIRALMPEANVRENNGAEWRPDAKVDAVIANPPFGAVKDGNGATVYFSITPEYDTRELDHAIVFKALESLKDNGRAVLIVGGVQSEAEDARREDYRGKNKRQFYFNLYNNFNVIDHFTADGDLYSKQGASYPVDVIVINGRGKSNRDLPAADLPKIIKSYEELKEKLNVANRMEPAGSDTARTGRGNDQGRAGDAQGLAGSPVGSSQQNGDGSRQRSDSAGVSNAGRSDNEQSAGGRPVSSGGQLESSGTSDGGNGNRVSDKGRAGRSDAGRNAQGNRSNDLGGTSVVDGQRVESGLTDRRGQEQETGHQVSYSPHSNAPAVGTLVPRAMRDAIASSLSKISDQVGDIDNYVAESLDMDPETVRSNFSAEQIDALALSIRNAEAGKGFIIGDQTGIGKGRVVAAMIRYALVNGKTPIFVTEKPNLYSDMIRDLDDIGMTDELGLDTKSPRILITNGGESIPYTLLRNVNGEVVENNLTLRAPKAGKALDDLMQSMVNGDDLGDYKVIFTTYSQLQTVKGKQTTRQRFVSHFGASNYMIFDESHNAGGAGETQARTKEQRQAAKDGQSLVKGRAAFVRGLVQKAFGTFFSSATYAKRPDVMDLYSSTNMKLAVDRISQLGDAIKSGGVPMQQVVANMLTQDGQYIRRERTFAGVDYNTKETAVDKQTAENMASAMRSILAFSRAKEGVIKQMQKEFDKQGAMLAAVGGESTSVQGANFGSIMHNLIDQMLLSLKAKSSVDHAIERLKAGEKVVMTVSNTMGSFLKDYADEFGVMAGDPVALSFSDLYVRYLEKQRIVSIKAGNGEKRQHRLTDAELGPTLVDLFNKVRKQIDESGFGSAPISPIDYMHAELRKAGYKTDEITGRTITLNYQGETPVLASRSANIKQRVGAVSSFNNGDTDVLILNQAGSTGLSLHASSKFKDKRKRHMIIVQAEKNIDTHMQMLGRVHRTGQVIAPAYSQMMADIPAEMRPASVLLKKMASLNANTTASRKSSVTAEGVVDFMNDYGGQVVHEYLRDNPDVLEAVGGPDVMKLTEDSEDGNEDDIRKFTGYVPILPIKQQEEIYRDLIERYNDLIERENSLGTNKLEAKAVDLDAETLSAQPITEKKDDQSVFAAPAVMEKVDVKRSVKPYSSEEVAALVKERLGDKTARAIASEQAMELRDKASAFARDRIAKMQADGADPIKVDMHKSQLNLVYSHTKSILETYSIGDTVSIKDHNGQFLYGVVTDIHTNGKTANPAAGSAWKMTFAIANGDAKSITMNFSQLGSKYEVRAANMVDWYNIETQSAERVPLMSLFDKGATVRREKRWIITGNLLAGYSRLPGQIITYTKKDGTSAQGILMSRQFDFEKEMKNAPVIVKSGAEAVKLFNGIGNGASLGTKDRALMITDRNGRYELTVPSSKKDGGTYFLDQGITDIVGDLYKRGSIMSANVYEDDLARLVDYLINERQEVIIAIAQPEKAKQILRGEQGPGNVAERQASLSPADKSVYGMVAEGKSAADILKFIASASRNPLNRQLAKLLLKTGIAPQVMAGQSDGWKFNAGNDKKYAAAYNPNTDTISLFRPAAAERNFLHEAMHAATLRALGKKGMAAAQMRALFNHVKKSGMLKGMYGMSDVDEFVAEAFTNPKFQEALKTIDAPASVSGLSSAWHWFVRVVRGILGLPSNQESALSQAIEIGLGVMREDMAMRQQQVRGYFVQASPAERKDALMRMPEISIDDASLDGMDKAAIRAEVSRRFKAFKNDPVTALDGREVRFNGVGLREMRAHSADIRTMLLTNKAPELMRKAIPLFSKDHVPSGPNDSIKAWHYYGAKVVLNGKTLFARIVAREAINGSIYYDKDLTTVEDVNGRAGDAILTKTGAAAVSADKHSLVSWLASIKSKKARFNEAPEAADRDGLVRIFSGLDARGLAKDKAEAALAERGDAERIKYIQDNFIDILAELEEAGAVQINCD